MKGKLVPLIKGGLNKNGSLILAGGALLGFGATVIFVARGQTKADKIIDERNRLYTENPFVEDTEKEVAAPLVSKREYFDLTYKCYIPAVVSGAFTIFCIIGSQYISRKQMAGLMATVAALTASRDQLEQAVKERYGEEALTELRRKLIPEKTQGEEKEVTFIQVPAEESGYGDLLCYEGYFGRWFRSSEEAVRSALNNVSNQFRNGLYISYNDIYDELGIERSDVGYEFGWCADDDYYTVKEGIQFLITKEFDEKKGEEVLAFYIKSNDFLPMEGFFEI